MAAAGRFDPVAGDDDYAGLWHQPLSLAAIMVFPVERAAQRRAILATSPTGSDPAGLTPCWPIGVPDASVVRDGIDKSQLYREDETMRKRMVQAAVLAATLATRGSSRRGRGADDDRAAGGFLDAARRPAQGPLGEGRARQHLPGAARRRHRQRARHRGGQGRGRPRQLHLHGRCDGRTGGPFDKTHDRRLQRRDALSAVFPVRRDRRRRHQHDLPTSRARASPRSRRATPAS